MDIPEYDRHWFAENVQAHEPALRSYLRGNFPALQDVDDIVQEAYRRLIRTMQTRKVDYPKAYLFATARNAALDIYRQKQTISLDGLPNIERLTVLEDKPNAADSVNHDQELQLLSEAIEALPKRCRQVLKLRKIYGLSHDEIAAQLGISKATVATQVQIGVRKCAEFLEARGVNRGLVHG